MRVIPIGVNSAFATGEWNEEGWYKPKLQSNFLLEFNNAVLRNKDATKIYANKPILRILIDVGGDARHGLKRVGLTVNDIDAFYVSHPHSDHIGGIECAALMSFF